jgi:phage terminase large subunit-like protein
MARPLSNPSPLSGRYVERAVEYARAVVAGKIEACAYVRAACQRQLDDLAHPPDGYRFDAAKATKVCVFLELLPHIEGEWAKRREKLRLEGWQLFVLTTVFGWVSVLDGARRFKLVYIEVPRKNAKSTTSAGVALYALAADEEPGAQVYSAATTREQARIVFNTAKRMAQREEGFRERYGVQVNAHNLSIDENASKFEPLSSDSWTLDGLNIHCAVIDELHAHKTREVYDVIETGTGARSQPLTWCITTSGSNRAGICYEVREYVLKILKRVVRDETVFGIVYTVDEGDEKRWDDPRVWAKANPNLGVSVYPAYLERLAQKARHSPSALSNFLTKHLDVWVNADTAWMDMPAWGRAGNPNLELEDFEGRRAWLALDLASKIDVAALAILIEGARARGDEENLYLFFKFWVPEERVEESDNSQYEGWVRSGHLLTTPGNVTDFNVIEEELRDLCKLLSVDEIAYDPYQATQLATTLLAEKLPMVEMRPTVLNFSEPMKQLQAVVIGKKFVGSEKREEGEGVATTERCVLVHDANPMMAWMVSNVVCHSDEKDNIYPRKERRENKIDGPVTAIMVLGRYLARKRSRTVYEKKGLTVIG